MIKKTITSTLFLILFFYVNSQEKVIHINPKKYESNMSDDSLKEKIIKAQGDAIKYFSLFQEPQPDSAINSKLWVELSRDYVRFINDNIEQHLQYIVDNLSNHLLLIEDPKSGIPLSDNFMQEAIVDYILDKALLENCDYFMVTPPNINSLSAQLEEHKGRIINKFQSDYIESIAYLFREHIEELKELIKNTDNKCIIKNCKLLVERAQKFID